MGKYTKLAWLLSQDVKARSGHGSPARCEVSESDAADPSAVLPRRGKTSDPKKEARPVVCGKTGLCLTFSSLDVKIIPLEEENYAIR